MTGVLYPTPSSRNSIFCPSRVRRKFAYRSAAACQPSSSTNLSSERRFMVKGFPQCGQRGISAGGIFKFFCSATICLIKQLEKTKQKKVNIESIDKIEAKPVMLSPSRVSLEKTDYETLSTAAKKYYAQKKKESKLQKLLDAANKMIEELKSKIKSLIAENSSLRDELSKYKSVRNRINSANLEQENERLQRKVRTYEEVISANKLWHLFGKGRGKTLTRDAARAEKSKKSLLGVF